MKRIVFIVVLAACKPSPQEGADRFCKKIEASAGGQFAPAQRDQCNAHYLGLGGYAKECIDKCVATEANGDPFNDCKEDCMGQTPPVQEICMRLGRSDLGCVQHYVAMQKAQPKPYSCVSHCIRREGKEAPCATKCAVSAAPPEPPSAVVPPPF